jgi:hypothetical protein
MIMTQNVKIPVVAYLELTDKVQFTKEDFATLEANLDEDRRQLFKFLTLEEFYIRRREWQSQEPSCVENFLLPSL